MKDLGLDSLDQVEIIMAMEDEFGKSELGTRCLWLIPWCSCSTRALLHL